MILLLFMLPKKGSSMDNMTGTEQDVIQKACASKRFVKRTCRKGCLKHQTHSEQPHAGRVAIDCSQQFYAIITPLQQHLLYALQVLQTNKLPAADKLLSPDLEVEPDPPQYS
ncbi:hypothetical protein ACSX1A_02780 [Pontibacter sp. MBLB2868]|uniref:hypothetical protein n=1 Tax=Pontibacter sp. MBLB2868 TaxID=3451555 RepID=UPI003F7523D4